MTTRIEKEIKTDFTLIGRCLGREKSMRQYVFKSAPATLAIKVEEIAQAEAALSRLQDTTILARKEDFTRIATVLKREKAMREQVFRNAATTRIMKVGEVEKALEALGRLYRRIGTARQLTLFQGG